MTDTELLNWIERNQACISHANHKFYVDIFTAPDECNKDSLRKAIERRAARKDSSYDD